MTNSIRPAILEDLNSIHQLFVECTDAMLAAGIKQWHYDYPAISHIRNDILAGEAFIIEEENQCLGTITLNAEQDEQYQQIKWLHPAKKVLVIHRLGIHPKAQGRGLGKQLCLFAEVFAQEQEYDCIRLDAYAGNPASNYLYEKLGYHRSDGLCHFHDNELPFYCYEKLIVRGKKTG